MNKITKIGIVLLAFGFLMWNPFTRQIIMFILPLGSGVDDLIFVVALAAGLAVFFVGRAKDTKGESSKKQIFLFCAILAIALIVMFVVSLFI